MVNANVIISVSAVLVALLLTIVIVMRVDGDPTDNFSVSVQGTVIHEGASYDSDMYYCIGEDCVFYSYVENTPVESIFSVGDSFPGYFALVGFTKDGKTYVTEHSIGYTFVYESETLTKCIKLTTDLDSAGVAASAEQMASASTAGDNNIRDADGNVVFTIKENGYSLDTDPTDDVPTVNGHGVPTVFECQKLWSAESFAACETENGAGSCGTGSNPDIFPHSDPANLPPAVSDRSGLTSARADETSRRLIETSGSFNSGSDWTVRAQTLAQIAQWVYKNPNSPGLPSGWSEFATCEVVWTAIWPIGEYGRSTARIAYKNSGGGKQGKLVVAFAGSNDAADWMYNAHMGSHSTYHQGFHDYVMDNKACLDSHLSGLVNHGVDYIIGHSLGGAAASTYSAMGGASLSNAKVVTWGAPKNRRNAICSQSGTRFFHQSDPVASNIGFKEPFFGTSIGALSSFNHDVSSSATLTNTNTGTCIDWNWSLGLSGWYKDGCIKYTQNNHIGGAGCADMADTTIDIDKHMMTNYRKHPLNNIF